MSSRSVLVVAGTFPDRGGSRIDKFVKYLPECGYEPVVVTTQESRKTESEKIIRSLNPAGVEVHYARSLGWSYFTERYLDRGTESRHYALLKWLSFPERCVFVPDYKVGWVPAATRLAATIAREKNIQTIVTSSPKESTHLIGMNLQRKLGLRWVADFRDLWTSKKLAFRPATVFHEKWIRRLERRIMATADHIVANTDENAQWYRDEFNLDDTRMSVIPNGFDQDDLIDNTGFEKEPGVFYLSYMGFLDKQDMPWRVFLSALKAFAARIAPRQVRLVHCGHRSSEVVAFLRENDMSDLFIHYDQRSHREAIGIANSAHLRLLLLYDHDYSAAIVPAKLYHYLNMDGPVLAVAPEQGAVKRILTATNMGKVVPPSRGVQGIGELLDDYYAKWLNGEAMVKPDQNAVERYDRKRQAQQLAAIL